MKKVLFISLVLLIILLVMALRERIQARRGKAPLRGNKPLHPNAPDEELLDIVIDEVAVDVSMYGPMREAFKKNVYDVKRDEYLAAIKEDRESIKGLLYLFAANFAADNLETGRFHTKRRTLTLQGQNMMNTFKRATRRAVEYGVLTPEQGEDNLKAVSRNVYL